jgi:hypothetical protein
MKTELSLVITAVLGLSATPGLAQITPGDPAGAQTIPEKDQSRPNELPKGEMSDGRSDSLSKKLNDSGGVIKPQGNVDPGLVKPAPELNPNSMPVIPPAGAPGGLAGPEAK